MEFVRNLLLFLHLLGMAILVAMFFLQRRTAPEGPLNNPEGPLNKGWLHGSVLQLLTGMGLVGVAEVMDRDLNHVKIGVKLVVVVVIAGLAVGFQNRERIANWLTPTLAALVVLNTGVAVFWS
ncbi:hypothetical protein GCM10012275_33240 [Longimycelium tulufanense]|uniref:Uncharacterized protein n=1 Tax=Longimycelium tulufanense TaxID=907463 RepID=A0A8J3CGX6_9PSEU|nr:hypothetical protein [Longimycelium tulufanense]GGM59426.1 hypothetical protein GCM10012275_33240 [Longimycelium tulufanense]